MATYVVGDVQGCLEPLTALLQQAGFRSGQDDLWLAGDLINRGPQSLETLRWVRALGSRASPILGNHELHLLRVAAGYGSEGRGDTLGALLSAPDAGELIDWVRTWPLLKLDRQRGVCMVHAGLPPQWSLGVAEARAREAEAQLRGAGLESASRRPKHAEASGPEPEAPAARIRRAVTYFTRMRVCDREGGLDLAFKGPASEAPSGLLPWFAHEHALWQGQRIVFGHWSALGGATGQHDVVALDTGCVWGGCLTALRLEDGAVFQRRCSPPEG